MPVSNRDGTQLFESMGSILNYQDRSCHILLLLWTVLTCFHILPPQIKEHLFNTSMTTAQTGIASSQSSSPLALLLRTIALLHSFTFISFFQCLQLLVNITAALFMSYCFLRRYSEKKNPFHVNYQTAIQRYFWYRECRYILHMYMHWVWDAEGLHTSPII